jgi:UDP-2,3-diacylglucosamine hydrolase
VSRRTFILSDAHLFPAPEPHPGRDRLMEFLGSLRNREPGDLVVAGDLFDYWFEHGRRVPSGFDEILRALGNLSSSGWRLSFLPGNHDWWVGPGFVRATGAEVIRKRFAVIESDGLRVLLAHGDGLGRGDLGYRFVLRPLLRNALSIALFSLLPRGVAIALARGASGTSRRILRRQAEVMPAGLAEWAARRIDDGFDVVITGHTHLAAEIPRGRGLHVSLGDWLKSFTWVELGDGRIELKKFEDAPPRGTAGGAVC